MADPIVGAVSIPSMDFRGNKFTNEDGTLTETAQGFFDLLYKFMVKNLGEEGLVAPTQPTVNKNIIQDNTEFSPTGITTHTCKFGTILYDSDEQAVYIAVDNGSGLPIFKQVSLI